MKKDKSDKGNSNVDEKEREKILKNKNTRKKYNKNNKKNNKYILKIDLARRMLEHTYRLVLD